MSLLLSIETSTPMGSVAILQDQRVLAELCVRLPARHSEVLLALVEQALAFASLELSAIDQFVVGVGPGSFTSVRIGMATARGLALAVEKPLRGVLSLHALAAASSLACGPVLVALDAHRGEFFAAVFDTSVEPRTTLVEPCCLSPAALAKVLVPFAANRPLPTLGDLSAEQWALLSAKGAALHVAPAAAGHPLARFVALEAFHGRSLADHDDFEPVYLRAPDIKLPSV